MTLLIAEYVHLLKRIFLVGEMSKFLVVGWDFSPPPPSQAFLIKVQAKGVQSTPGGSNKATSKE